MQAWRDNSAAASNVTLAASQVGCSIFVTDVFFWSDTSGTLNLLNDATSTGIFLRLRLPAGGGSVNHSFKTPYQLTANLDLAHTTNVTNTSILVTGYIAPV